ncbi:hypothetical protein BJ973_002768 [Actinoplanes tereljensis]|uniref:Uncharacterized protein n=1 Tax=Paractinoplanes tereljensis TaxID=571912 RepID=A0A919TW04_9ACTN|nr:hypothetical protein [Actinoplanes tereljensis]GIF22447.1 hypothetical protein Ate02nite_51770 [Actinoplanes tereljensis]
MRRRSALILGVVLLLAAAGGVTGRRWWHNRPPYGPEALNAQATLQLVDQATADAALKPVNAEVATDDSDQIFLGHVSWTRPPHPQRNGSLRIVLLDQRRHLLPGFIAATAADPDQVGTGSDGSLDLAEERYPWLRSTDEGAGSTIAVSSLDVSPVTFQTVLHTERPGTPPVATAPALVADLLVALICVGPDGQVYWAQRLLN